MIKEKFSKLYLNIFNYKFYVYKVINDNSFYDNSFGYEVIAIKDNKEYYVCKMDYDKTKQGIRNFLLKDIAKDLKSKYKDFNFKVLKVGIKVNDKIFRLKEQCFYYDLKLSIIQYIVDQQDKNISVA